MGWVKEDKQPAAWIWRTQFVVMRVVQEEVFFVVSVETLGGKEAVQPIVLRNEQEAMRAAPGLAAAALAAEITALGVSVAMRDSLAPATRATYRPANYAALTMKEQWEIDKRLGLLDWDGT